MLARDQEQGRNRGPAVQEAALRSPGAARCSRVEDNLRERKWLQVLQDSWFHNRSRRISRRARLDTISSSAEGLRSTEAVEGVTADGGKGFMGTFQTILWPQAAREDQVGKLLLASIFKSKVPESHRAVEEDRTLQRRRSRGGVEPTGTMTTTMRRTGGRDGSRAEPQEPATAERGSPEQEHK